MPLFGSGHEIVTSTTIPATAEEIVMAAEPYVASEAPPEMEAKIRSIKKQYSKPEEV